MKPKGTLWAVDPFFKGRFGFSMMKVISHKHVGDYGDHVRWIEDLGCNAATVFADQSDRPVDFIFIDGDHSWDGISGDWEAWYRSPAKAVASHCMTVPKNRTSTQTHEPARFATTKK